MYLSAVSLGLAISVNGAQVGRLKESEQRIWQRMEPSIAFLVSGDRPSGAAALIDDSGLFVAAKSAVSGDTVQARLKSGTRIQLHVIARSASTGLVLLQADDWKSGEARPFSPPHGTGSPNGVVLAVLGTGPIRAQFVEERAFGVLSDSRRLVPLAELRFEAPAETIGTALIVCEDGEIVGALNATLRRPDTGTPSLAQGLTSQGLPPALARQLPGFNAKNQFGPGEMTVAYTVGREVVRQVIEGFRSPDHAVAFPSLGVQCKDNVGGGAVVEVVTAGSAAQKAGIRVGDVIQDINGVNIRNNVSFAREMLRQQIGAKVTIRLSRGGLVQVRDVIVGKSEDN